MERPGRTYATIIQLEHFDIPQINLTEILSPQKRARNTTCAELEKGLFNREIKFNPPATGEVPIVLSGNHMIKCLRGRHNSNLKLTTQCYVDSTRRATYILITAWALYKYFLIRNLILFYPYNVHYNLLSILLYSFWCAQVHNDHLRIYCQPSSYRDFPSNKRKGANSTLVDECLSLELFLA